MRQILAILLFFISGFAIGQGYKINLNIGSGINQKIKLDFKETADKDILDILSKL